MSRTALGIDLPQIGPCKFGDGIKGSVYIGAAGFEDRCFAWLAGAARLGLCPAGVIGIEYRPRYEKNRPADFSTYLSEMHVPAEAQRWLVYDRFAPNEFAGAINAALARSRAEHIILDVSGMSKLLIVIVLRALDCFVGSVDIVYAEAGTYFPTQAEVDLDATPGSIGTFLTKDVHRIVTTGRLTSIGMQGYPLVVVAFATFNFKELDALVNELGPQWAVIIDGAPHSPEDAWRLEAVKAINRKLESAERSIRFTLSTFAYEDTIGLLEELYQMYSDSHRIMIAPTGSKLQATGVGFFHYMRPDVQIVYPVTSGFASEYTEGCKAIWAISVPEWRGFVGTLSSFRKRPLRHLHEEIVARSRRSPTV